MLTHLGWLVLGIEDGQFGEHAHMGTLQTQGGLKEQNELLKVAAVLVVVDQLLKLVGVNHNVETAHLGQTEFLAIHTREADLK